MQDMFALNQDDRLLAVTTIAFDISALEIYLPLISGSAVVLAEKETVQDPSELAKMIETYEITIMQATPTLWYALASSAPEKLKGLRALVGGEALQSSLARQLQQLACSLTNLYGPTETTIWSTAAALGGNCTEPPGIGCAIWNTQLYVLDAGLQPVPPGTAGELYVAGTGVARGYSEPTCSHG